MLSLYENNRNSRLEEYVSGDLIPRSTSSTNENKVNVFPNRVKDEINIT